MITPALITDVGDKRHTVCLFLTEEELDLICSAIDWAYHEDLEVDDFDALIKLHEDLKRAFPKIWNPSPDP